VVTSSRAGVAADVVPLWAGTAGADCCADNVAEIVAIKAIDPHAIINVSCVCRVGIDFPRVFGN
jgi:hypothetical protein